MAKFIIKGGKRLSGTITPLGNKNAVLPMLAAAVLTDEPVSLRNVPRIRDVDVMLELLEGLGVDVQVKARSVTLCAKGLKSRVLDKDLCRRVRGSIILAGPLAARHGHVTLYPPGGDVIGRRRVDTHFTGLQALGISLQGHAPFKLTAKKLQGAELLLEEASVTATENVMMAACLAKGVTKIYNAACEPHVQDLGHLLKKMGAHIEGLGTNLLRINGVKKLGGASHTVAPDHIEMGSYLTAVAATGGKLTISPVSDTMAFNVVKQTLHKLGVEPVLKKRCVSLDVKGRLSIRPDLGSAIPKIEDGIWPAFPSDLMSGAIVLASQAKGTILFHEKMFESRMYFVDRLIEMGAQIIQCDPHRVIVTGPCKLHGTHQTSPDIRAGMSLLIAALCAKGESVIDHAQVIDRGYEHVDDRLRALGADIERAE